MAEVRTISLRVNGSERSLELPEDTPLLYVLRNQLGLKGARFGCGEGLCGACTVHVDGQAAQSCGLHVWQAEGKEIATIESLSTSERLHPLQEAILEEQAGQCGYCLTGMVMTAIAHLSAHPAATEDELRAALGRHLCRCGVQLRVLKAIRRYQETLA
jgi:nicotinate dehydrogenase subunit A